MMDNISIKTKNWMTLALFVTTLTVIALISFSLLKETIVYERKAMLVDITNMAHTIIRKQYALYQAGKLGEDEAKKSAIATLRNLRMGKHNYVFVYKGGVAVLAPENPQNEGKDLIHVRDINGLYIGRELSRITQGGKAGFLTYYWYRPGSKVPAEKLSYARGFEPWGWYVGTGVYQDDLRQILISLLRNKVGILLLSMLIVIALGAFIYTINRSSVRRTLKVKAYLDTLGQGDFTVQVIPEGKDEIGQMMRTLTTVQTRFEQVIREVKQAANSVVGGVRHISDSTINLNRRTTEQAGELARVNATLQQIADTTRHNALKIDSATHAATDSRMTVAQGENAMHEVCTAMEKINQSSAKVHEIVTVIDDLAFQTNLLALNAAVEAARAGEQGRGFAVVATEVRNLAQRSSESAQEIRKLIDESSSNVKLGTDLVDNSGQLLREILGSANKVTERLAEISRESKKQSRDLKNTSQAVDAINAIAQENLALIENAEKTSAGVNHDALLMCEKMQFFVLQKNQGDTVTTASSAPGIPQNDNDAQSEPTRRSFTPRSTGSMQSMG